MRSPGDPRRRLEKAEKNVERFVSRTVKPYVEMAAETPGSTVKEAASWARDVWVRLNISFLYFV